MPPIIDLTDTIDRARAGRFQLGCILMCVLILICDSIDLQAVAYTGPAIREALHLRPDQLGPVFSAGLFGMMLGSFLFTPFSDRLGRRPVLITAVILFGLLTLATALAETAGQLVVLRFLAGLGFGGALPNSLSLAAEYMPRRNRFFLMTLVGASISMGGSLSGLVATALVPLFGWRSMYLFGGAFALAIVPILMIFLPESVRFLAGKPERAGQVRTIARRIAPSLALSPDARFIVTDESRTGVPIRHLFIEGRAALTIPFWIACFCILLVMYFVLNWVPVLARDAGMSAQQAIMMPTLFQVGATCGSLSMGLLMDRVNPFRVIGSCCACAALAVAAMGSFGTSATALLLLNVLCGYFIIGAQGSINAASSVLYPTHVRATGVGYTLGVGRMGSLLGPLIGGELLTLSWTGPDLLHLAAAPLAVASCAALLLAGRAMRATARPDQGDQQPDYLPGLRSGR